MLSRNQCGRREILGGRGIHQKCPCQIWWWWNPGRHAPDHDYKPFESSVLANRVLDPETPACHRPSHGLDWVPGQVVQVQGRGTMPSLKHQKQQSLATILIYQVQPVPASLMIHRQPSPATTRMYHFQPVSASKTKWLEWWHSSPEIMESTVNHQEYIVACYSWFQATGYDHWWSLTRSSQWSLMFMLAGRFW